jgi:hypothetical protein
LFFDLESNSKNVQNCFKFLENIKSKKLFSHGQRILDNFNEMQELLNEKVKECLDSFSINFVEFGDNLFEISKKEVIFTNDIRKKLKMFTSSSSCINEEAGKNMHNVNIHEMKVGSGPLDEECFLDNNMDQLSSNLMSSLNLLNEKVMKNEFDFSNQEKKNQKSALMTHQVNNRFPLKEMPLNVNFMTSQSELSDKYRDQIFHKQNILSSVNIDLDLGNKPKRTNTTKSNKNFKIKPRQKHSQGNFKKIISKSKIYIF